MRIMYDSVTPTNILNHANAPSLVGGYANGKYQWSDAEWGLFPRSRQIRIAVRASEMNAHALDCEVGDATPTECPDWAMGRRVMGGSPIVYCNRSTWSQVIAAFNDRAMQQPMYWIATASGKAVIPDGAIGAQYLLDWQGVDVSVMVDYIPGVDPNQGSLFMSLSEAQETDLYNKIQWMAATLGNTPDTNHDGKAGDVSLGTFRQMVFDRLDTVQKQVEWMYTTLGNTPDTSGDGKQGDLTLIDFRQWLVTMLKDIDAKIAALPAK